MKELWINHKQVDFTNAARQQKITPGCAILQEEEEEEKPTSSMLQIIRDQQQIMQHPAHHEVSQVLVCSITLAEHAAEPGSNPSGGKSTVFECGVVSHLLRINDILI